MPPPATTAFPLRKLESAFYTMLPNIRIRTPYKPESTPPLAMHQPTPLPSTPQPPHSVPPPYLKSTFSIHTLPTHSQIKHSPLSKEANEQSYRGLVNVAAMLLFVSNLRLIMENLSRYGWLIQNPFSAGLLPGGDELVVISCIAFLGVTIAVAYLIERDAARNLDAYFAYEHTWRSCAWINIGMLLIVPSSWTYFAIESPMYGTLLLLMTTTLLLKLVSYHLVNLELRYFYVYRLEVDTYNIGGRHAQYPYNISLHNLVEFVAFPTLCYQPTYPRTPRVRIRKVLRHLTETVISFSLMYIIIFQYIQPLMRNTLRSIQDPETKSIQYTGATAFFLIERLLKLSSAITPWWLIMFYSLFHAWVNFLAELTRFGDREFYLAWWNSSTIAAYWRLWNQPVHSWLKRHIYIPMIAGRSLPNPHVVPSETLREGKFKYTKLQASCAIFFVSAVFHELIIALPVKILRLHAFNGIFVQVPLILLTGEFDKWYRKRKPEASTGYNTFGNLMMWVAFCVAGLPMGLLLYYIEWCQREQCVS